MNKALLIVDIQNDYFPGGSMELYEANSAAKNAADLLMKCRLNEIPVVFMQHIASEDSGFFKPNTHGVEIHDILRPLPSESVLEKKYPNSFRATPLLELLHQMGVKDLVICGMMTHMCIDSTVRAAYDLGFNCTLIGDACATRSLDFNDVLVHAREVHTSYLSALNGTFAKVIQIKDFA